ncbi:MAG: BREX-1 system adenine-specific DNA-methyltransferase PglX [Bacteroidales bacterium]|jgi:hypothetical protein|nr:BREX-1 system adenine-specific DNA-methyltransferase PglX [Bacteroidales bacterium]
MNTNDLKRFAQQARIRLINTVRDRLNYVLETDTVDLRDYAMSIRELKRQVASLGKEAIIDKVAYTWFNRLMALRFMDANDYQPLGIKVVSPKEGFTQPEILNEASRGHIPEELKVDRQRIYDLLDGKLPAANPQNEVYRMLLIASCNHLNILLPFLFEKINDYTELLLPDDLVSELSIIHDFVQGMCDEDCREVEILGWLYQFYISEYNAELISSKKVYDKDEIAPASQLFTPKWIVQYMVDNTLGQLWAEMNPSTTLLSKLDFYITPDYKYSVSREKKNIEKIRFFDPCVGSGHILVYAFDLFYKIYEEEGYIPSDIPFLILKNNLFGVDIDERATQIASFSLLMKAREKYSRLLKKIDENGFSANIFHYEDFLDDDKFSNAKVLGSLIRVKKTEASEIEVKEKTIFGEQQSKLKNLYKLLSDKYDVVVTNPPYLNSSRMEPSLKEFVNKEYANTKTDLFATFILRCLEFATDDGLTGNMTPFVWMFITSYEKLRKEIINKHFINNLIQLEYSGFDGATVPICTFTLRNKPMDAKGSYIRLSDFRGAENQAPKTLEAISDPDCGWFYTKNQKKFKKIPGNNIGYWLSEKMINLFDLEKIDKIGISDGQNITGNNDKYLRMFWEINKNECKPESKWPLIAKGGSFRRWAGNIMEVINWSEKARNEYKENPVARIQKENLWFRRGITWNLVSSIGTGFRLLQENQLFNKAAPTILFDKDEDIIEILLAFLNTKITTVLLNLLNPTLNTNIKEVFLLPLPNICRVVIVTLTNKNISISIKEWNSRETSWDFTQNELIRLKGQDIEEAVELYKMYWTKQFRQLHQNEEELNKEFIHIYGLEEELTPDVPLEDITILRDELDQKKLKKLSEQYRSGWKLEDGKWEIVDSDQPLTTSHQPLTTNHQPPLPFNEKELIQQFISYAVGCMMGRYSLDKEGLILANQGETFKDYLHKTGKQASELKYIPDEDGIIPVLESEWFTDDIVTQFREVVRAVWGAQDFQRNIAYIEKVLGKPLRAYFYRDFYNDHIQRYQKRPVYWMVSSPGGAFGVLIYMHRYNEDMLNNVLNNYLRPYIQKLENHMDHLDHVAVVGSAREQTQAKKDIAAIEKMIDELRRFDREVFYPLATERIRIDLDDGVLVNYNKFGNALKTVAGLNDAATKKKVKKFDWIDGELIR